MVERVDIGIDPNPGGGIYRPVLVPFRIEAASLALPVAGGVETQRDVHLAVIEDGSIEACYVVFSPTQSSRFTGQMRLAVVQQTLRPPEVAYVTNVLMLTQAPPVTDPVDIGPGILQVLSKRSVYLRIIASPPPAAETAWWTGVQLIQGTLYVRVNQDGP